MPPAPPPAPTSSITARAIQRWREGHGLPGYSGRQEAMQAAAMNEALQYMDPTTRGQMMRQMARTFPALFGSYASAEIPEPPTGRAASPYQQRMLAQQRLTEAVRGLSPESVVGALSQGYQPSQQVQSFVLSEGQGPLGFLNDYLRTAQQAYGTGVGRGTRAQRAYAEQRLQQLSQEAEQRPEYGAMAQLGQALVNPVMAKAPTPGGLGTYRSVTTPQPKPQRGGMFRAGGLT